MSHGCHRLDKNGNCGPPSGQCAAGAGEPRKTPPAGGPACHLIFPEPPGQSRGAEAEPHRPHELPRQGLQLRKERGPALRGRARGGSGSRLARTLQGATRARSMSAPGTHSFDELITYSAGWNNGFWRVFCMLTACLATTRWQRDAAALLGRSIEKYSSLLLLPAPSTPGSGGRSPRASWGWVSTGRASRSWGSRQTRPTGWGTEQLFQADLPGEDEAHRGLGRCAGYYPGRMALRETEPTFR